MSADVSTPDQPDPPGPYSSTATRSPSSTRGWGAWLGVAIVVLVLIGPFPTCVFKVAVGAPCPGCGLTRATLALMRLDFAEALRFHPLAPLISPLLGWALLRPALVRMGIVSEERFMLRGRSVTWLFVGLVLLLWVVYVARLAGALGGHPDPVQLHEGWLTRWWF